MLENLSTHTVGALDEAFPAPEAHRILPWLEFHHTPKHAEVEAWQTHRNASGARIDRKFTTLKARDKLACACPNTAKES